MNRFIAVLSAIVLLSSCAKEPDQSSTIGKVQFSVSTATGISSGLKSAGIDQAKTLLVTITDASGSVIKDSEVLTLYNFNGELLSQPLSFSPGEYVLTKFLVTDSTNNIIFATPVEGSELAYLVERPLPINITISKDNVTKVTPEVISTDNAIAQDFGYTDFAFQVIETFNFYLAVFVHNPSTNNLELTSARIRITSGTAILFDKELTAATNYPRIRNHYDAYTIEVSKEGYETYQYTFTNDSLKKHGEDPLEVLLGKTINTLNDGLIAYYPFDGNADDESGNELNGTVSGATLSKDRKGKYNSAYFFNGNGDYIAVANNNLLKFDSEFSISVWINLYSTHLYGSRILDKGYSGTGEGFVFDTHDNINNTGRMARLVTAGIGFSYTSVNTYSLNTWHHLVAVYAKDYCSIYIDGVLDFQVTHGQTELIPNDYDMYIGHDNGQGKDLQDDFHGLIDDIRIYNRPLSVEEVNNLYSE